MQTETTGYIAAAKSGMDDKTARKYVKAGKLPSELMTSSSGTPSSRGPMKLSSSAHEIMRFPFAVKPEGHSIGNLCKLFWPCRQFFQPEVRPAAPVHFRPLGTNVFIS